ncbi:dnaJ protein ERDJ3A [Nymphaea colorata]|nr:dnaJ protein ERDJ3A [Nymphaea colorata]
MLLRRSFLIALVFLLALSLLPCHVHSIDPYKVLGIDRKASQRDIQKAFHKLSLQYHPDKNKDKSAQAKFSEINNAYEILSDEEKRKNYDLYGDEKGGPIFSDMNYGGPQGGSAHFTYGGHDFGQSSWHTMGKNRDSETYSYSSGKPGGSSRSYSFDFGSSGFAGDLFSNIFDAFLNKRSFSSFSSSNGPSSESQTIQNIPSVNRKVFKSKISDQGLTWLLLFYMPNMRGLQMIQSILQEVVGSLKGALKVGSVNCKTEQKFCKELGVWPSTMPRIFVYSYRSSEEGSLVEYSGDLDSRQLRKFCQDQLPRFSKRVDLSAFDFSPKKGKNMPQVVLLSTKKETPVIWRTLCGLYRKQLIFYDAEIHDVSNPVMKGLKVDSLPAIVGILPTGEKHILSAGMVVNDLESGIKEISELLEKFEKKYKKASKETARESTCDSDDERVPLLTKENVRGLCGEKTSVCIIGVFRKPRTKEKLQAILSSVSQKRMMRRQDSTKDMVVSYSLLDASKQPSFLYSFDMSGFKSSDGLLVSYKPRKERYAVYSGDLNFENVEDFVGLVLSGDVQFKKILREAELK